MTSLPTVALSRFAEVTARFVMCMLPAWPSSSTSALASRFWISARSNVAAPTEMDTMDAMTASSASAVTVPAWMLSATTCIRCANAAESVFVEMSPAVMALIVAVRAAMASEDSFCTMAVWAVKLSVAILAAVTTLACSASVLMLSAWRWRVSMQSSASCPAPTAFQAICRPEILPEMLLAEIRAFDSVPPGVPSVVSV